MAGNAVIGALRVVLGLDTAALDKGLKDARGTFDSFGKSIAAIAGGIGLEKVFEQIGAAIGQSIKSAVKYGDELNKASQKYGMPVEQLSALKYAADLADVSFESLTKGLARFNRGIVDAGRGQGQALEAFAAMGVNIRDGNGALKSSEQLLGEVAAKFASYKDGAEKTALAIALFGRAGADMIPLLNQGKEGLQAATEEAQKFGLIIDKDAAQKAEDFNDNLRRLGAIWQGVFIQVIGQSIGILKLASGALVELGKNSDLRQQIIDGVASAFETATRIIYTFITVVQRVAAEFVALKKVFTVTTWEGMKAAWAEFTAEGDRTKAILEELPAKFAEFKKSAMESGEAVAKAMGNQAAPALGKVAEGMNKLKSFMEGLTKQTAAFTAQSELIGKSQFEVDRLRIIYEGFAVAGKKVVDVNSALYQSLNAVATAHAAAQEKAQYQKQIYDETRTPAEQYQQTIENLSGALQRGSINQDLFNRGVQQAAIKFAQADPYFQAFENSVTSAFDKAIQGTMKFNDVLNQLLRDLARALANAAFKQLLFAGLGGGTGGGFFSQLFAGGLKGFATGGSFDVGGSGGIDSQLVAFRASPNERVTVSKDGQDAGGSMTFNYSPIIDARGADAAAVARLAKSQQDMANTLRPTIRDEFNRYRQQVPGAV